MTTRRKEKKLNVKRIIIIYTVLAVIAFVSVVATMLALSKKKAAENDLSKFYCAVDVRRITENGTITFDLEFIPCDEMGREDTQVN